ncbi:MAG: hypothetical protein ACK4NE_00195 [Albidovulum sp.]
MKGQAHDREAILAALHRLADPTTSADVVGEINVAFSFDGWEIVLFNDADTLDYVDSVKAPDGSSADFDELWLTFNGDATDHLPAPIFADLEARLLSA